ncbi:hypothetical protein EG329_003468 [Mollisiaceae sp. DMI_Dod_QoI]|nr:hypothetical protein EG329_003468 [Helotiales sp. DMI_Dod_QoI]
MAKCLSRNPQHQKDENPASPPSWAWLIYAILTRVPGGWISSVSAKAVIREWCPKKSQGRSFDRIVSIADEFFKEKKDGVIGWRLANVGEKYEKGAGPRKPGASSTTHPSAQPSPDDRKRKRKDDDGSERQPRKH